MADYYQSIKNTVLQNKKRSLLIVLILFVIICLVAVFVRITRSKTANTQETELLIYPSDNIETIKDKLKQEGVIKQGDISFTAFADILKYSDNIKTGHYIIKPNTTMINLVRKLRTGKQQPVRLVINNARTADDFAKKITEKLMITPQDLTAEFDKKKMDYPNDIFLYIIPDTYEVFWNTGADNLCDRLWKESSKFWEKNKEKLKLTGLTKKKLLFWHQ